MSSVHPCLQGTKLRTDPPLEGEGRSSIARSGWGDPLPALAITPPRRSCGAPTLPLQGRVKPARRSP